MDQNSLDMSDKFINYLIPNQKRIMAYILSNVSNYAAAEDILQNTVSILWKKFDQYQPGADFVSWAIGVARNEIMSYYRKCKKEERLFFNETLRRIIDRESASENKHLDEGLDALRMCVKKLTDDQRNLIKMRYEQEMSFSKIGDYLGISSPAVFKKVSMIHSCLIHCVRVTLSYGKQA